MRALLEAGGKSGLRYLGRGGVVTVAGLNVAFLDGRRAPPAPRAKPPAQQQQQQQDADGGGGAAGGGGGGGADGANGSGGAAAADGGDNAPRAACPHYTPADLELAKGDLESLAGDVDLLLTCEWPDGVLRALPADQASVPGMQPAACAAAAADLAALARPRYHFAGGQGVFYARAPYASPDLGAGPRATRFIGLAHVGNAAKQKFLHALALAPSAAQTPEQLSAVPEGATASPFVDAKGRRRDAGGGDGASAAGAKRAADAAAEAHAGEWRWQQQRGGKRQRPDGGPDGPGGAAGGSGVAPATAWGNAGVEKNPAATVFVKNLPFAATVADVEGFFARAGRVVDIRRGVTDAGRPNSWAHVQFDCAEAAARALQLAGGELLGRALAVEPSTQGSARGGRQAVVATAPAQPVEGCWFCLSSDSVDVALVASVGDEAYVALDKGQVADTHALVVPIEHYPSMLTLPPAAADEVARYLSSLRAALAAQGLVMVGFERHLALRSKGGNHCHVNVVGVPPAAAEGAREAFEGAARAAGFELEHVPAKGGQLDT